MSFFETPLIVPENGPRKTENMTLFEAMVPMKRGLAVRRPGWSEIDCIGLARNSLKFIRIGDEPPMLTAEDVFATDWEIA